MRTDPEDLATRSRDYVRTGAPEEHWRREPCSGVVDRDLIGVAMPYLFLAGAILAEVLGTTAMKASEGFTRVWPASFTVVGYLVSFTLLAQTLKTIQVGTAYAIWSAAGTALICAIGIVFFNESASLLRMVGIALIIGGVVILNLAGTGAH